MNFDEIRLKLLNEAKASPNLLSDLAGLEKYIGESYNNRSFIELLQNADDAQSKKFKILKQNDVLFVANDGKVFDQQDLESLCRSASSNKARSDSIGYRGIGFKSVVSFAKEIHLFSNELEITFSKENTKKEIPEASQVPLIRIPHNLSEDNKSLLTPIISNFKTQGYSTIFVFFGVTAHEIELEFTSFDTTSLLFLRNILEIELNIGVLRRAKIEKTKVSNQLSHVNIISEQTVSTWIIENYNEISIAYNQIDQKTIKIEPLNSIVYSFLPTETVSGLGVLINGDFSTDPSRKHIIYDNKTLNTINLCAHHILNTLLSSLQYDLDYKINMVNALIPYIDPRMLQFKKPSFEKYLLDKIRSIGSEFFANYKLCPNWLNLKDYYLLTKHISNDQINPQYFNLDGFFAFVKYLGSTEDTFYSIKNQINTSPLSKLGCAQISAYIFKNFLSTNYEHDNSQISLKILMANNKRISIEEIKRNNTIIDQSFLTILSEIGLTEYDLRQVFNKLISREYSDLLFAKESNISESPIVSSKDSLGPKFFPDSQSNNIQATKLSVHRWRSSEEIALDVLNSNGFNLKDVSKQNIGYDYEGTDPEGREIQIEVKSITMIGQKIKLTNNEIAVAQEKRDTYYLAIVRQLENYLEVALVPDPTKNLVLNRQCIQWIWECSNYDYNPTKFPIY